MFRRHWWIIVLLTAVGVAGAFGFARTQPKIYEATTNVLVMPTSSTSTTTNGRTNGVINLDTEAQLVTSAEVATQAATLLKVTTSPGALSSAVSIDVPPNTTVLAITFAAGTPQAAQAGSHAFATAYLANRQASAQADLTTQTNALSAKIKQQTGSLTKINNDLAILKAGSARYANEQSQRQTLTSQITTLTNRLNNLSTTTVTAGKIITDAPLPTTPTSPSVPLFLTSGAMLGLLLGLGVAVARQRSDKRVRFAADVPRRSGLALLGQLPARVKPRFDDVYPPYGAGGRTFNRLRNEVLASLRETDKVIVVTGASKGPASTLVAANLASALARAGSEVVLVSAHLPENMVEVAPTTRMLGVSATPGLSDVLAGKVPLETATQRAPRNPWLRVITTGGTASATGFLQSQTLRDILGQLRTQAEYVVVEAPSTANTADAQSLASLADASIVVVELRRTTHLEVLDAADQLRRVTTTMLGCVVLPRLKRQTDEPPTQPLAGRSPAAAVPVAAGPYIESQPTSPIEVSTATFPKTPTAPAAVREKSDTPPVRDELTSTATRRRILPARRNERRTPGSRRPSPLRPPGSPLPGGDETIIFDSHGGRPDGPKGSRTRQDSGDVQSPANVPTPAGGSTPTDGDQPSDANRPADTVPVADQQPVAKPATTKSSLLGNIALPQVGLTPATPINPTNITAPVLGARSIVITPAAPRSPVSESRSATEAGAAANGNGNGSDTANRANTPGATSNASGTSSTNGTGAGTTATAVREEHRKGAAPAQNEPRVGSDDTATFARIDLVYVEDGDSDGAKR